MNVKIGTEAMQFPEKEYINGIFLAVRDGKKSRKRGKLILKSSQLTEKTDLS
jgi:hypothetical protein